MTRHGTARLRLNSQIYRFQLRASWVTLLCFELVLNCHGESQGYGQQRLQVRLLQHN